jgi:anti-sigma regulatory factor (Ser/Thr protein kinase)
VRIRENDVISLEDSAPRPFRHEALLYDSSRQFVERTSAFIREGLDLGEAVLTVVDAGKIDRLRTALGDDSRHVEFADMAEVGRNPALIIQAWRDFAGRRAEGESIRGIGEPISATRSEAALVECHIHESLLNVAFERDTDFWLLCPYDTASLPDPVIERAMGNHDFACDHDGEVALYTTSRFGTAPPLPDPPGAVASVAFDETSLHTLRRFVDAEARGAGVDGARVDDLVVAASEIATNSVVHGGGPGRAVVWTDGESFVSEFRGLGQISDPLAGRLRPDPGQVHGYGLWLANQFCDLVQIRSGEAGTTVRLHVPRS